MKRFAKKVIAATLDKFLLACINYLRAAASLITGINGAGQRVTEALQAAIARQTEAVLPRSIRNSSLPLKGAGYICTITPGNRLGDLHVSVTTPDFLLAVFLRRLMMTYFVAHDFSIFEVEGKNFTCVVSEVVDQATINKYRGIV